MKRENTVKQFLNEEIKNEVLDDNMEKANSILSVTKEVLLSDVFFNDYLIYRINELKQSYGYVYLLLNEEKGYIKIGSTKDLQRRLKEIKNDFKKVIGYIPPLKLVGVAICFSGFEGKLERIFHKEFQNARLFSEWFDLSKIDLLDEIVGFNEVIEGVNISSDIISNTYIVYNFEENIRKDYINIVKSISIVDLLKVIDVKSGDEVIKTLLKIKDIKEDTTKRDIKECISECLNIINMKSALSLN